MLKRVTHRPHPLGESKGGNLPAGDAVATDPAAPQRRPSRGESRSKSGSNNEPRMRASIISLPRLMRFKRDSSNHSKNVEELQTFSRTPDVVGPPEVIHQDFLKALATMYDNRCPIKCNPNAPPKRRESTKGLTKRPSFDQLLKSSLDAFDSVLNVTRRTSSSAASRLQSQNSNGAPQTAQPPQPQQGPLGGPLGCNFSLSREFITDTLATLRL